MNGMWKNNIYVEKEIKRYITLIYPVNIKTVANMVIEHYDTPEYANTLFVINGNLDCNDLLDDIISGNFDRRIYYYLEHGTSGWLHTRDEYVDFIKEYFTEIWAFEYNVNGIDKNIEFKLMPMRYTSYIDNHKIKVDDDIIDLGFLGVCNYQWAPYRGEFFDEYYRKYKDEFGIKILNGKTIYDFSKDLSKCKFILDMPRVYNFEQNQVRLFESICAGYHVLSKKSKINWFPGLINEWETLDDLNVLVHTIKPSNFRDKYKELTYSDTDYENYKNTIIQSIDKYDI